MSNALSTLPPGAGRISLLLLLGAALGAGVAVGADGGIKLVAMIVLGLAAPVVLAIRPRWAFWLFVLALLVIEEFPAGQGETVERSTRTAFYAKSLGLGGLYVPDLWMLALLAAFVFLRLANRRPFGLTADRIGVALLLLATMATTAIAMSFMEGNPFAGGIVSQTTGLNLEINEQALRLIALFQFKIFFLLFASYVLTQLVIETPRQLRAIFPVFFVAALCWIAIGVARLVLNPGMVPQGLPLFYDSPSSWFFALFGVYAVASWAHRIDGRRRILLLGIVSAVLLLFILISFRRTMWGGIALAFIPLLAWLPAPARGRLLVVAGLGVAVALLTVMATPLRETLLAPVMGRMEQTNIDDASTLYRLAIAVRITSTFSDIPLFGYGVRPLWNEIAALGFFRTNLENIHSLYWWWLLRTGHAGMLVGLAAIGLFLRATWQAATVPTSPQMRALGMGIFLALVIFLFSGLFNPVYAEVRYVVPAGMALAMASRILQFARAERTAAGVTRID